MKEEFEDTKGVIRIRISKKNTQHNGQKTHKTKDRVTRTHLKTGSELGCSGRVLSSCSTSENRRVYLVTNPVICHEWRKDREVFTTSGTYPSSFVTQIFHNGNNDVVLQTCRLDLHSQGHYHEPQQEVVLCLRSQQQQHNVMHIFLNNLYN